MTAPADVEDIVRDTLGGLGAGAEAPWPEPVIDILNRSSAPPPPLPMAVFGDFWGRWLEDAAESSNAPVDYVALPLLIAASSLLGNARWVVAWRGWAEPPVLWGASVGNPSSGKTSGATPIMRGVMGEIERHLGRDFPDKLKAWQEIASVARAINKQWEKDVARAVKNGEAMPPRPNEAIAPPKPVMPRARVIDSTIEKLTEILAGTPKGLLCVRDELSAWLLNLSRYANGGSDRPFWLEAWSGGPMRIDRVKNPEPIFVSHLSLALFGTVQPDRLDDLLADSDDGLVSRFLWVWPASRPFRQPTRDADIAAAVRCLTRLADLRMAETEGGELLPSYVHLADDARAVIEDFGREAQERERAASPLVKSTLGKARGQVLRLAITLEYLWWSASDPAAPEPDRVSRRAVQAAAALVDGYFLPGAARVFGDCAVSSEERNMRTLANWIVQQRPERVNVSLIRDTARLSGLRESDSIKQACRNLEEAGWLRAAPFTGQAGRPRGDYLVNPRLWEAIP